NIAKALRARLSELTNHVVEIDSELRKPLSADLEEQATDLENQDALEAIENSEIHEIHQIQEALKRISVTEGRRPRLPIAIDSDGLFPGQLAPREPIPAPRIASVRKTGILPRVIQSKTGMAQPRSPAGRAGLFLAPNMAAGR